MSFSAVYPFYLPRNLAISIGDYFSSIKNQSIAEKQIPSKPSPLVTSPVEKQDPSTQPLTPITKFPDSTSKDYTPDTKNTGTGLKITELWLNSNTYMSSHIFPTGKVQLYVDVKAKDVSYAALINFLRQDETDKRTYQPGSFVCSDFAETLQHNATLAGLRCAYVNIEGIDHACNAFNTTDRGLVFIDDVRSMGRGPGNQDCIVSVSIGQGYCPKYLFPEAPVTHGNSYDYTTTWWEDPDCMGIVTDYHIYWTGR